ncbi:MAG: HAMP domain-containing histidine kinase [Clostridiales bacterium]|nr:HAMP domain-containing histidine kinase [Clostridiales bacterium]
MGKGSGEKTKKKKSRKASSLFKEYFVIISLIILASFTILGLSMTAFLKNYWEDERIRLLSENVRSIAHSTAEILMSDKVQDSPSDAMLLICNDLSNTSKAIDADVFICDIAGNVACCQHMHRNDLVLFTGRCLYHQRYKIPEAIIESLSNSDYSKISTLNGTLRENSFVYISPIVIDDGNAGMVVAVQSVSGTLYPFILSILKIFGLASLVAIFIALIVVYLMTYAMTKPLRQMSAVTKSYAKGDFSERVSALRGSNEMAELAAAFNKMANSLASLESSRRSFVANVSHELKTPMTTIGGFIDGILDGTIDEAHRDYYLKIVSEEIKRLSRLVTGMLNMSKIESGEFKLNPTQFDIAHMIFNTTLAFEQLISNKNIEIRGLDKMLPLNVTADEDMLHQVVYNLIDNAVKFTPEGGYIELSAVHDNEKVYVSIKNSGDGISSEELPKIFERFYKVDKSRSYDVRGAGLGLYIVKTLVELHDGKIAVTSKEGEYTEFSFTLPYYLASPKT